MRSQFGITSICACIVGKAFANSCRTVSETAINFDAWRMAASYNELDLMGLK